jgi:hypothetical protein
MPKRQKYKQDHKLTISKDGYRLRKINGRNRPLHRLIAEKVLGRELLNSEVVHHQDNNKLNNDVNNLWVFPSQSAHRKYHTDGIIHPLTIILSKHADCSS